MTALSRIVSSFDHSQKLTGTHLAGLWCTHLPLGICWYGEGSKASRSPRCMAPSSPWASLLGPYRLVHMGHLESSRFGKPTLLVTLESASVISSHNSRKLASITDGAISVCGNITGLMSFEIYSGAIFLVNGGNAEIFKDVRFDENDEDGSLITSTGSHPSEKGECAIGDVVRQVERPGDCTGSLYILPIEQMNSHLARTDPVSASR